MGIYKAYWAFATFEIPTGIEDLRFENIGINLGIKRKYIDYIWIINVSAELLARPLSEAQTIHLCVIQYIQIPRLIAS